MWRAWIASIFAASVAAAQPAVAGERQQATATTASADGAGHRWSLLGFDICFGESRDGPGCDVTLPAVGRAVADPQPQAPPNKRITVLGKTLCIGGAPTQPGCDVRLPPVDLHG